MIYTTRSALIDTMALAMKNHVLAYSGILPETHLEQTEMSDYYREKARICLDAIASLDCAVVPRAPTHTMIMAGAIEMSAHKTLTRSRFKAGAPDIYQAMVKAAPYETR